MSDDMKPCPFCGDKTPYTDEASCRIFGRRTGHHFAVACSNCEVSAPGNGTMEDAIAAWNTRADLLNDPVAVYANMLRGTVAKPTVEHIIHLYGVDALCKAMAPIIVREASHEPATLAKIKGESQNGQ